MTQESEATNKHRVIYHFDFKEPVIVSTDQRVQMRVYYDGLKELKESLGRQNPRLQEIRDELARVRKWML